ncbi:MAG: 4Fe-4S binding protein [Magnetococcales bacterium]|nr:4Fe-4S binding protein [Magnetococcales bacterium]
MKTNLFRNSFPELFLVLILLLFWSVTITRAEAQTADPLPGEQHEQGSPPAGMPHDHGASAPAQGSPPAGMPHDHGATLPAPVTPGEQHDHGASPVLAVPPAPATHGHDHAATMDAPHSEPILSDHTGQDHSATHGSHGTDAHGGDHAAAEHGGHGAGGGHQHPGLPLTYVWSSVILMVGILLWGMWARPPTERPMETYDLSAAPVIGGWVRWLNGTPWPLVTIRVLSVVIFLGVVYAGLFGSPLPERNLATFFVWNLWWPLVVVSVFFVGSVWCSMCPWDTLASWLVRRRLWRRVVPHPGLNRRVPQGLRNVWPALLMFMGLTWLELGIGVTRIPMATALMAILMVILALVSLVLFERKAFCRYFCPVGRTLGFYSRLAPIGVRSRHQETCDQCKTMECYNGSAEIEPCPTHLTIGRFSQNTWCLSCGNCALSCPYKNVSWRLRPPGSEALAEARPMWDGAWFMLALLGITSFHGVTMMPFWHTWIAGMAQWLGETGQPIWSFTIGMLGGFLFPVVVYAVAIGVTRWLMPAAMGYRRLFVTLPFSTLPLAFAYHLSHNLDHLYRETGGTWEVLTNPLGTGMAALTAAERQMRMAGGGMGEQVLFLAQSGLMILGLWLAVEILRYRGLSLQAGGVRLTGWRLAPMLLFIAAMTAANLWLMAQNMSMRF